MKTKKDENKIRTSDPKKMQGKYTAERVLKTWKEDFKDEDTGEVVSIERNEIIMHRGVLLDADNLQTLVFSIQTGEIKDVLVSNQKRGGEYKQTEVSQLWEVTVNNPQGKAEKCYLYAESLEMGLDIAKDYHEQTQVGGFSIKSIKPLGFALYLEEKKDDKLDVEYTDEEKAYIEEHGVARPDPTYKLEVDYKFYEKEAKDWIGYNSCFIVVGENAEICKSKIAEYYKQEAEKNGTRKKFKVNILTATTIKVNQIVSLEFCKNYFKKK